MDTNKHPLQLLLESYDLPVQSYSGRGMYGKTCLGVVIPLHGQGKLLQKIVKGAAELAAADDPNEPHYEEVADAMDSYATDFMGKSDMIVYWPDVPFTV